MDTYLLAFNSKESFHVVLADEFSFWQTRQVIGVCNTLLKYLIAEGITVNSNNHDYIEKVVDKYQGVYRSSFEQVYKVIPFEGIDSISLHEFLVYIPRNKKPAIRAMIEPDISEEDLKAMAIASKPIPEEDKILRTGDPYLDLTHNFTALFETNASILLEKFCWRNISKLYDAESYRRERWNTKDEQSYAQSTPDSNVVAKERKPTTLTKKEKSLLDSAKSSGIDIPDF